MLLTNCKILINRKLQKRDILIENGKIKKIDEEIKPDSCDEIIDINGKIVFPGLIDSHVHFREPGLTHKEDFYTGSVAAVAGGVTTFIDMPNVIPPTTTAKLLEERRNLARKSLANYGFHFGGSVDDICEIKKSRNIASTKIFLNSSTGKLMITDEKALKEIFKTSKIMTVHAEDEKVRVAIDIAKETNTKLYLCHISQISELKMIKESGLTLHKELFVEVTPHHLFLTDKDKSYLNIMKPPLRTKEDQESLWNAIKTGIIDTIGTDHAPHLESEKKEKETYGVPGIEFMLPLLLDASNKQKITLQKIQELACENPAKIFSIKNKGFLKEGYDADLTIIDLELTKKIERKDIKSKCGWSPYEGKILKGWPIMTIVGGNIVYSHNKINNNFKGKEVEING